LIVSLWQIRHRAILTMVMVMSLFACQASHRIADKDRTGQMSFRHHSPNTERSGRVESIYFEHFWKLNAHRVLTKQLNRSQVPMIVAIEGDGRPWRTRYQVALDPTSPAPVLSAWLSQTQLPVLYIGRPCYHGGQQINPPEPPVQITGLLVNRQCDPYWYTFGRYSQVVVTSLVEVINRLQPEGCLILLGHSGGGTLAMLIARELTRVQALVTLSGNLSVSRWQQYHQFTPLVGSLDPAMLSPLSRRVEQFHLAASGDEQILPQWVEDEAVRQQGEYQLWELPGHKSWSQHWSQLDDFLERVFSRQSNRPCP